MKAAYSENVSLPWVTMGDLGVGIAIGRGRQRRDVVARPCDGRLGLSVPDHYQGAVVGSDHSCGARSASLFDPWRSVSPFSDHCCRGGTE